MKSSYKTTTAGIASILAGLALLVICSWKQNLTAENMTLAMGALTGGIGLIFARDNDVSSEEAGATPAQKAAVQSIAAAATASPPAATPAPSLAAKVGLVALLACGLALGLYGCAGVSAGSDPLVVRTEQLETMAYSTFDTFLKIDDTAMKDASVSNAWASSAHPFAQYLRKPIVNGTNTVPFGIATVLSVDQIKLAYEAGTTTSNALTTALNALTATVAQASQYTSLVNTNK